MRLHILLIPLLSSIQTYAWGSVGHVVAAAIAHQFLTDEAHSKIDKVLARDPYIRAFKSIKATRPKITTVAIWADLLANTPKGKKTSDLHFVDLQARESRFSDEGMQSILSRDNIVQAIVHYVE
ncbi:hypothetical protein FRC02_008866 [Tulasnella sp. 418]|nr:hypothetical protein FRC02_008866 [Tulasnella sp. 418]